MATNTLTQGNPDTQGQSVVVAGAAGAAGVAGGLGSAGVSEGTSVAPYRAGQVGLLANATGPEDIIPDLNLLSLYVKNVYGGDVAFDQAGSPEESDEEMVTLEDGTRKVRCTIAEDAIDLFIAQANQSGDPGMMNAATTMKTAFGGYADYFEKRLNKIQKRCDKALIRVEQVTNDIRLVMRSEAGVHNATNKISLRLLLDDARVAFRFAVVTYDSATYDFNMPLKRGNTGEWWERFEDYMQEVHGALRSRSMWFECQAVFEKPFQTLCDKLHIDCNRKQKEVASYGALLREAQSQLAKAQQAHFMQQQVALLANQRGEDTPGILRETAAKVAKMTATARYYEAVQLRTKDDLNNAMAAWQNYFSAVCLLKNHTLFPYLGNKYDTTAFLIRKEGNEAAHPLDRREFLVNAVQYGRMLLDTRSKKELTKLQEVVYPNFFRRDGEQPRQIPGFKRSYVEAVDSEVMLDDEVDVEVDADMLEQ